LRTLLSGKIDVNAQDTEGRTPLHLAMESALANSSYELETVVSLLLTNGAQRNIQDKAGRTPLQILASERSHWNLDGKLISLLSDAGWDYSVQDQSGETPLHLWIGRNDRNVQDLLKRVLTNQVLLTLTNGAGDTLLHKAIKSRNRLTVEL